MQSLILGQIIGITFIPFILASTDIWTAQTLWVVFTTLGMVAYSFIDNYKPKVIVKDKLFALFFIWVCLIISWYIYYFYSQDKFSSVLFMEMTLPFFNIIIFAILYKIYLTYFNEALIKKIINVLKWTIIGNLLLCVLQYFGISQFTKLLDNLYDGANNPVCGILGQPTQLASWFGMFIPILMFRDRVSWISLGLLFLLLFFTGTTKGDPSVSGFVVSLSALLYVLWHKEKFRIIGVILVILTVSYLAMPKQVKHDFFFPQGRYELWKIYIDESQKKFITGNGLGAVQVIAKHTNIPRAKHVHSELLQSLFELGIGSVIILIYMFVDVMKIKVKTDEMMVLKGMILSFVVATFFNFPAHIWYFMIFVCFAYAGLRSLNANFNIKTN